MRNLFHSKLFAIAASAIFACMALPSLASAEICNKIDYTFPSKIMDQVKLYSQNSAVYASDAACIMRHISFASYQEEVGVYLSGRIADPENIDLMINAVTFPSTKEKITKAALENPHRNNHHPAPVGHPNHPQPAPVAHPNNYQHGPVAHPNNYQHGPVAHPNNTKPAVVHPNNMHPGYRPMNQHHAPHINVVQNVNEKIDYTFNSKIMDQVKLYVGNSYIYASDAAEIIRKSNFPSTQKEIGAYLCPRIADRENLDQFINAADFPSVRESLVQSCMN